MDENGERLATIHLARRPDGGLRVWSDDLPGLVLSHADPERVMSSVLPAIDVLRTYRTGPP